MSVKVSIVIPVYNVEKYIKQTLDSVINQTFKDIEIIVVDNKSTDKTLEIVSEYAKKDSRFVIHKNDSNLKQGIARNLGIQIARGEYIFFLDGDDYIELNAVEKLYKKITETDSDIVICTWNRFCDLTGKSDENHIYAKLKKIPIEFDNKIFNWKNIKDTVFMQSTVPWDKIYKRDFLIEKNIKFPENIYFEDNVFVFDALFKAGKISILREDLIFYRYNRKNSVTDLRNNTFFDYFEIFNLIEKNLKNISLYDEVKYNYLDYKITTLYWLFMQIKLPYKKGFFNRIKSCLNNLNIEEKDKEFLKNRTLFLINRFTKMNFNLYYPLLFFLDKIFRIEYGKNSYTIIFLSLYKKKII